MIRTSEYVAANNEADSTAEKARTLGARCSAWIKRCVDFLAALLGLITLSPIFALIAILIKRDSPGPVFYWGPRIGRHGKIFHMLKFRTMYEEARSYQGARVTGKGDDRITPVGRWLRDTKLNELPQLWNVLIGEMSLVGPRPEDPSIGKTWPARIAREILQVRPGITSPASVVYRDEEKMLPAQEVMRKYLHDLGPDKMRLDQLYVRYRSMWLDLDVIFWTFLLLLPRIRSYSPPEQFLFVGPVSRLIQRYVGWFLWDFAAVLVSIGITGVVVRWFGPLDLGLARSIEMAFGFAVIYSLVGMALGVNRIDWRKATFWQAGRLWASWLLVTIAVLILHHSIAGAGLRIHGMVFIASLLSLASMIFLRYRDRVISGMLSRLLARQPSTRAARERVLIVGSGRTAEHLAWLLDHPAYSGKFQIVGFIDDDLRAQGMKIYGSEVVGQIVDIQRIAKARDVGVIILADNQMAKRKFKEFREIAQFSPARIVVAPDIFGSLSELKAAAQDEAPESPLDDFQCQHCLARFPKRASVEQRAERRKPARARIASRSAALRRGKKLKRAQSTQRL